MSLGRWPTGNGELGDGTKCPFPSPKRTLRFSLSWLATRRSRLPSRFTSAIAMGPGPLPVGITTSVNDGATDRSAQIKALANPKAKKQTVIFIVINLHPRGADALVRAGPPVRLYPTKSPYLHCPL